MRAGVGDAARPLSAAVTLCVAAAVIVVTGWLATAGAPSLAQTGLVECFNHPPQPVAAVFALVDPLFRPIPLTLLSGAYVAWLLLTTGRACARLEIVRALVVVLVLAHRHVRWRRRVARRSPMVALHPHRPPGLTSIATGAMVPPLARSCQPTATVLPI